MSDVLLRPPHSAMKRYALRTAGFMLGYVGAMAGTLFGAFDDVQGQPAAWALAAAVTAPIIGQIWATLSLMRESDEFVRTVIAKRFILAAGLAMAVATFWGFGESFADAPHVPAWFIYPLFWAAFGLATPLVRSSR